MQGSIVMGKKYKAVQSKIDKNVVYTARDAIQKVKDLAFVSFDESVDVNVRLGIDPSKGEQAVRGSVLLSQANKQDAKIVVFAKGEYAAEAEKAGADYVGGEDLIQKINDGWLDFDYAVATPDLMGKVGKLAKILGPRGKLPNKKMGTVTFEVGAIIKRLKEGLKFFKNDKQGLVNFTIGKVSFDKDALYENLKSFLKALNAARPPAAKGSFLRGLTVSSTMGIGLKIGPEEFLK